MTNWQTTTKTANPPDPRLQSEFMHRAAWKAAVLGSLNVVTAILAVRLILLVGVGGAFALAYFAVRDASPYPAAVLLIYAAVVVVPLVWLAARQR